ncbi:DUF1501 domain-containing protein [Dyella silvatica]|uniref:DUF1501 domain-containing protein n=1 Tax=Dyella silvatica TaxID=2992128 RepID=UPI00224F5AD9|nr:DUF1501 domain-containing protein [Dyella silvatica]
MPISRREFLRRSMYATLGGVGMYSGFGNLRLLQAAALHSHYAFNDYKALVCVYLYGGNDSFNTIVPYNSTTYATYAGSRVGLALAQADIQANNLIPAALAGGVPGGPPSDGAAYGLHPAMPELRGLFNAGHAAVVANVGSLLYPITQRQFQQGLVQPPPQLFSHDDQTAQWQTSRPDDANANGWGGRMADMLSSGNANPQFSMSMTLAGTNLFQRGAMVNQYAVDPGGVQAMSYLGNGPESWVAGGTTDDTNAYNALIRGPSPSNALERAVATSSSSAIDYYTVLIDALSQAPALTTTFPDTELGNQLNMVAQLLQVRAKLGVNRQIFFVSASGYDTHTDQLAQQQANLSQLSQALSAFYSATVTLGLDKNVTAFTASDFGRSLSVNSGGTDHGWGGHHFVVGGAVRGQRFYGTMPSLLTTAAGNPDDTGYGQIIPTTAVDQYAATLASWLGVNVSDIASIFPNLSRFNASNLRIFG